LYFGKYLANCAGAVAKGSFDGRAEFAERAMVFYDFKQRIVAKAARAGRFKAHAAVAVIFGIGAHVALWIGERGVADVMSRALSEWHFAEFFQQKPIVRLISGAWARKTGRVNPRSPAEGIDGQPAIFAEHPAMQMPGLLGCLGRSIFRESLAGFFNLNCFGQIGERQEFDPQRSKQFGQLDALFAVPRAEDEVHGDKVECGRQNAE
jgi:hypothetical protein